MASLDPIVSLSVALAEAPGTCAFFLGSGVSRDAGVPTGGEVLRETQQRLRQVEMAGSDEPRPQPVSDSELQAWLLDTGKASLSYSELLELWAPDPATRREYLAGFFEGIEPGRTHHALADLAARGLAKVFVTTNFDRLLEHALQARGIEPIVLASDADLETQVPREHGHCVIVKPHGDYLQQTIRNTVEELAELDPGMTKELSEIFDRYGLVVLGYSGSDPGISQILSRRRSRYGIWWVSRRRLDAASGAGELVRTLGGRTVVRDDASAFLADLDARLTVWEQHPTGQTPAATHDQILALLQAGDEIGVDEYLRRERHTWYRDLASFSDVPGGGSPANKDVARATRMQILPALERRLAGLLPVATYDSERFLLELKAMAHALERIPRTSAYTSWLGLPQLATSWIGYVLGAWLVRTEEFEALGLLVRQRWNDRGLQERFISLPGETHIHIGQAVAEPAPEGRTWTSPFWMYLTTSLPSIGWLTDRYPELLNEGDQLGDSLAIFDLLVCLDAGLLGEEAVAYFDLDHGQHGPAHFTRRLRDDDALRARVALALGSNLGVFDQAAASAVRRAAKWPRAFSRREEVAAPLEIEPTI